MKYLPRLKRIKKTEELNKYVELYVKSSGLPIPDDYIQNEVNQVFGIYWKDELIGGFILGRDPEFRTIDVFSKENKRQPLYAHLGDRSLYTEICCFWIDPKHRKNTYLNFFTWLSMTYALRFYGTKFLLFGTCSKSLARLYGQTEKSILIHKDFINRKSTYIFYAKRSACVTGMLEIIRHKLMRTIKIRSAHRSLSRA